MSGDVEATRTRTPFLHVANGTSTTMTIEAAGIPGALSIWADPLHDGPVPGGLTDAGLVDVRARHLAGDVPAPDVVDDLNDWRRVIERHASYDELVLWFEHDLFDQLNLVQLLTWIHERLPESTPVSLICIGSFPGRPTFKGLGELTPGELAPLLGTRRRIDDAQYRLAARAWDAFRAPTPEALDALRQSDTTALPYLAPALTRFLQEFPWTGDGLSRTERRFLQLAADGSLDLRTIFPRMHQGEDAYYVTDMSLLDLAGTLSAGSTPLLTFTPGQNADRPLQGSVAITAMGRAVLDGRQDRMALDGIDRWFGGVHLQTGAARWRWDDASQAIVQVSA